jgi:carbon-monoxide dehydrogenase medium subunit
MLPDYGSLQPATLKEALGVLAGADDLLPVAGGTNVVMVLRAGGYRGKTLMDVTHLPELRGIGLEDGHLVVGGGVTAAELLDSPFIAEYAWPLHQAVQVFANPLIRNRATVAGNIADASPAADMVPPLLVLDAEVMLASASGSRRVPLDQFIVDANQTQRRADELIVSLRWPFPAVLSAGGFHKLALRKGSACSVLSVAVMLHCSEEGSVSQARIAMGALASKPIRAYRAEDELVGRILSKEAVEQASRLAAESTRPIDDVRGSASYRRRMARVLTRRLLTEAAAELGQEWNNDTKIG